VSFDDERFAGMSTAHLASLLEAYYRLHPGWRGSRRATFLLDEIQLVSGWERFARRLLALRAPGPEAVVNASGASHADG